MKKKQEDKIKVLSARNQILTRPQMWIGSMDSTEVNGFLFKNDKLEWGTINYVPAFLKIINEVLDNSIDAINNSKRDGEIKVNITDEFVEIIDSGPGIPIVKKNIKDIDATLPEETRKKLADSYLPETCWTQLFAGSNFENDNEVATIGSHGVGSKASAIFSQKFVGTTYNNGLKCVVTCKDNLDKVNTKVSEYSGESGTKVVFYPDLARFGLSKIEDVYKDLIEQRLNCLSVTFSNIKFSFNKKRIRYNDKTFIKACNENVVFQTFENGFVGVFPNAQDEFNFMTYVNGLHLNRGGSHIDYIANEIINPVRDRLVKKFKNIRPGDIKQKLTMVVFLRDFKKPKYDSQTKETLTNSISEVNAQLRGVIDFDDLAKKVLKNDAIINPIIDTFRIKEELKARQEIKKVKRIKISADKYTPPIGEQNILALSEGQSAVSSISQCLGRNGIGYYALRGLPLNVYDQSIQKIAANQEVKDIINILNLSIADKEHNTDISFNKIVFACDQDTDALHIISMLIGWFIKFAPHLFEQGRIFRLNTPLIILKDSKGKIVKWFFNLNEFKVWESKNDVNKYKILYLKGLGSLEKEDLDYVISQVGLDGLLQELKLDDKANVYIEHWLGSDSEPRKEYLRNYTFNVDMI